MQANARRQPKSEVLACRCTRLEAELIRALAAKEELTVSEYLRAAALVNVSDLTEQLQVVVEADGNGTDEP